MADSQDPFDALVNNESREDKLKRCNLHLQGASDELASAVKIMIDINQQTPMSIEDMEFLSEQAIQVRGNLRAIKQIIGTRLPVAYINFRKEQQQQQGE